jgi:hypothetical protein
MSTLEQCRARLQAIEKSADSGVYARAYADDVRWLLQRAEHHDDMLANLTATQKRCTELLDQYRALRMMASGGPGEERVLAAVAFERRRQDEKWGKPGTTHKQDALAIPNGTGGADALVRRRLATLECDGAFQRGAGTWALVMAEETAEVLAETDTEKLRAELTQVAAVAVKWLQILDMREAKS